MEESHRSYKFCGNKLVYGEPAASYQAWKHNYLDGYNALLDDWDQKMSWIVCLWLNIMFFSGANQRLEIFISTVQSSVQYLPDKPKFANSLKE